MDKSLAALGIVFVIFGLFLLIFGLTASYHCPAEYYVNGKLVGGCGYTPLVAPILGICFIAIGAILIAISVRKHGPLATEADNR